MIEGSVLFYWFVELLLQLMPDKLNKPTSFLNKIKHYGEMHVPELSIL